MLAITVGYEFLAITRSNPEPAKQSQVNQVARVLIPARERPLVVAASANAPAVAEAASPQTEAPHVYTTASVPEYSSRVELSPPVGSRPKDHSPPPDYASPARNEVKLPPSQPQPPPPPPMKVDSWEVQITAKASYYNLGGHVDKNGIVDSLASSYLGHALKKHKNYPKLPPQIQAYINAPNINLTKIAGSRAMLGIDDKEMEKSRV